MFLAKNQRFKASERNPGPLEQFTLLLVMHQFASPYRTDGENRLEVVCMLLLIVMCNLAKLHEVDANVLSGKTDCTNEQINRTCVGTP